MKQFSKIRHNKPIDKSDDIIFEEGRLKIIQYEDWKVIKDVDFVVCIPYLIEYNQIIIRSEYIPAFKWATGQEYHVSLVCGGIETGETPEIALLRELQEEAGIVLRDNYKIEFKKPLFISKGNGTKFYPAILNLTESDYHEVIPSGDGSKLEKMSKVIKLPIKYLKSLNSSDVITEYMLLVLSDYLNLNKT